MTAAHRVHTVQGGEQLAGSGSVLLQVHVVFILRWKGMACGQLTLVHFVCTLTQGEGGFSSAVEQVSALLAAAGSQHVLAAMLQETKTCLCAAGDFYNPEYGICMPAPDCGAGGV